MHIEAPASAASGSIFLLSVTDAGVVQVDGGTPQEVVDLLQSAGNRVTVQGDLGRGTVPDPSLVKQIDQLSERELEIITLISSGLPNAEIATEMYISINTVKTYVRSAYRKMNVKSRSQAVIWAIDRGVVTSRRP